MPNRPNRISACCEHFAGHEPLTFDFAIAGLRRARPQEINKPSIACSQIYRLAGGIAVFDALVFEFVGLAMLALCVIVLVVPAQRRPARHVRDL
jgi:hypothetical protein